MDANGFDLILHLPSRPYASATGENLMQQCLDSRD